MRCFLSIILLLLSCRPALAADADTDAAAIDARSLQRGNSTLRVEVIDVEDRARAQMLHRWIAEVADAAQTASGRFPLRNARVRIAQIDSRNSSPVPWGQTRRQGEVSVLLYVRRDATYRELRDDWTAIHELAHLFHPYLGDRGRWLAEGLASYYQNVLRARAGVLQADDAWERLDAGFRRGEASEHGTPLESLGMRKGTMRIYWAGAAYWLEADLALRRDHSTSLDAVLDRYARCCLHGASEVEPQAFVVELDRIAKADIFVPLYRRYARSRTFPDLNAAYRALGLQRHAGGLHLNMRASTRKLREAVMRVSKPNPPTNAL
jgi:M61 glycyl aminopeptidase